MELNKKIA